MFAQAFVVAAMALGAAAQSESASATAGTDLFSQSTGTITAAAAQTTITGLVGEYTSGFAGSVVSADGCDTTLAMQCTDEDNYYCSLASDITVTVVQNPSAYEVMLSTSTLGGVVTLSQSCDLRGPASSATEMVCVASAMVSAYGTSTASKTTETLTSSEDFQYAQIPITAGASNLPSGSPTCTSSDSAARPTAVTDVYKVVVPIGAAIMAGAFI